MGYLGCEALTGGTFDRVNCPQSGAFGHFFFKSNARGFARGQGGQWAFLELTEL